jgi:DEAD/DEAH box helicase domain-containing protein
MSRRSASWPSSFLDSLEGERDYAAQIVHRQPVAAMPSAYQSPDPPLPEELTRALAEAGIERLYAHQTVALQALRRGEDVIVVTGTASGKSLCYALPIGEAALDEPGSTALYLAPTKALAASQHDLFKRLRLPSVLAEPYDGDTPPGERRFIRQNATLILTNPDMLHVGILPNHGLWARTLRHLKYVVIDEAHSLRGVFGTHVALTMRRLRRIAAHYGSDPRFVLTSATCANPGELARLLTGREATLVDEDGAPRGEGVFALWNPPVIDEANQRRRSANGEAAELVAALAASDRQTLAFCKSRQAAELVRRYVADQLDSRGLADRVGSYRGGYLSEERRAVEAALNDRELLAVATTTALELGVDIAGVDAVVENGFPGTVSSLWQQAGRAGRGRGEWLAMLVGHEDPLEQYYLDHPDELFGASHEAVRLDPENPYALKDHVACAAVERPVEPEKDEAFFGPGLGAALAALDEAGVVGQRAGKWHWRGREAPAPAVDIRATGGAQYAIVDGESGAMVGTIEGSLAQLYVYPGAIYLHSGEQYLVRELDTANHVAVVDRFEAEFYTMPRELSDVDVLQVWRERELAGAVSLSFGLVKVTTRVTGFRRLRHASQENLGEEFLDLPPVTYEAHGVWLSFPPGLVTPFGWDTERLAGSLHAAEHGAIGLAPLLVACDRWDLGGVSTAMHPDTGTPAVFVYEGHAGGVGIVERLYALAEDWLRSTMTRVAECGCEAGCPSCVHSPKCGNMNEPLDKGGAVALLAAALGEEEP